METNKVWLVTQESNVDGQITFNVIPCKDLGTAILEMKKEIDTILDESPKYEDARRWMEGDDTLNYDDCPFVWENENHDSWYLEVINDDYYEDLRIEEKEIIYEDKTMLIDLILDRKDGQPYNAKKFYDAVTSYLDIFP